jgi:hypothetical protein
MQVAQSCVAASSSSHSQVVTLADMEGNETFDPACLGQAAEVAEARVGDGEMIYIKVRTRRRRRMMMMVVVVVVV